MADPHVPLPGHPPAVAVPRRHPRVRDRGVGVRALHPAREPGRATAAGGGGRAHQSVVRDAHPVPHEHRVRPVVRGPQAVGHARQRQPEHRHQDVARRPAWGGRGGRGPPAGE